jgi:hypothetical protein
VVDAHVGITPGARLPCLRRLLTIAGAAIFMLPSATGTRAAFAQTRAEARVPVLVELFTAEGCSSCPPADVLLDKMLEAQPAAHATLVGLGEHVDYWNASGWKDRFSSAAFTKRQQQYAARSGAQDVYTPQMVIDGGDGFVGTDIEAARRAIEHAAAAEHGVVRIGLDAQAPDKDKVVVNVDVSGLPAADANDTADLLLAITEDGLRTEVKHGENQGRTLTHAAVVRELVTVGTVTAAGGPLRATVHVDEGWRRDALKIVAFVQHRRSRRVVATAVLPLYAVR